MSTDNLNTLLAIVTDATERVESEFARQARYKSDVALEYAIRDVSDTLAKWRRDGHDTLGVMANRHYIRRLELEHAGYLRERTRREHERSVVARELADRRARGYPV